MRRGTSLIEVLITLALLALALGMVAASVQQYTRILRKNDERSLTVAHLQQVSQIADELSQAVELVVPSVAGSGDEIRFKRLNPAVTDRLPALTPTPPWDPRQADHLLEVQYLYDAPTSRLLRTVTFPPTRGSPQTWVVATGLSAFSVTRGADGELTLGLSFMEGGTLKTLSSRVNWWLP